MKKIISLLLIFLPFFTFSNDFRIINEKIIHLENMLPTSNCYGSRTEEIQKYYKENEKEIIFAIEHDLLDVNKYVYNNPIIFEIANINIKPNKATLNILNAMIEKGANINAKNKKNGNTFLIEAIKGYNDDLINFLIEKNINLNIQNNDGDTALLFCCRWQHATDIYPNNPFIKYAKLLIEKKANLDILNKYKQTALAEACEHNNEELIEYLIKAGANVNKGDEKTPFHYLCEKSQNIDLYKLFIQYGVDINKKRTSYIMDKKETITPLSIYLSYGTPKKEIVSLLLENKADPNLKDLYGNNALYYAIDNYYKNNAENSQGCTPEIIELLLKYKTKISQKNNDKISPLSLAVSYWNYEVISIFQKYLTIDFNIQTEENGNLFHSLFTNKWAFKKSYSYISEYSNLEKIIDLLQQNNININGKNKNGETPLMIAFDDKNIIQLLISKGADLNLTDKKGNSALHFAAFGEPQKVKVLLENGADPNLKNKDKKNAYESLISEIERGSQKTTECISLLYNLTPHTENELTLKNSIIMGNLEYTKKLMEINFNKNDYNEEVFYAIESNIPQMLSLILQKKPDLSYRSKHYDNYGYFNIENPTPLLFAMKFLNIEMVEMLLQNGADPNQVTKENYEVPLLYLIKTNLEDYNFWEFWYYNDYEKYEYYLHGSNNYKNMLKNMLYLLINYGTDINYYSEQNQETIFLTLFKSKYGGDIELIELLLNKGADVFVCDNKNNTITDLIKKDIIEEKQPKYFFIIGNYIKNRINNETVTTKEIIELKSKDKTNIIIRFLPENTLVKILDCYPDNIMVINNNLGCNVKIQVLSDVKINNTTISKGTIGYTFSGYLNIE